MPLTHVCIWDPQVGFRRTSIGEACELYPHGASAKFGYFVCELCAQNVLLTAPGDNVQHFRHDPSSPNKECDERQQYFDPTYGRRLKSLNSHDMPLRLSVNKNDFRFEIGFFNPADDVVHCDKIRIFTENDGVYEYSAERLETQKTTYLGAGEFPSKSYRLQYVNADQSVSKFWNNYVDGVSRGGTLFDYKSGRIIPLGGKAYFGNDYFLLQSSPLYTLCSDISCVEISKKFDAHGKCWRLYKIAIRAFTEEAARFFLKYSIFLTERPTKFYPIWPTYVKDPYFIYHNSNFLYFYLCGDDAELKSYPAHSNSSVANQGKVYSIVSKEREQLVSIGKSGALGFTYLIKQPLNRSANRPQIEIFDDKDSLMEEDSYSFLPRNKTIFINCDFDGRIVVKRNNVTIRIYAIIAEQNTVVDDLTYNTEVHIYQGLDCVRTISFYKSTKSIELISSDEVLLQTLMSCSGPSMPATQRMTVMMSNVHGYPMTKAWLRKKIRSGTIPIAAFETLKRLSFPQ